MSRNVELVTFRLVKGTSDAFVAANAVVNTWLQAQPGFVSRHLAERTDGGFVDVVMWESHEAALQASSRLETEMGDSDMMSMIDPMSVSVSHAEVRLAVDG